MARFGHHAAWYAFTSDRFDHSSELPPDANAGNQFYGRDVGEFISTGLTERGLDASFFDEDWGWQVHAGRADGSVIEVSIYHNPEEDPATEDRWVLLVRLLRKERALGLFPRFRETSIDAASLGALTETFAEAGIELERSTEP